MRGAPSKQTLSSRASDRAPPEATPQQSGQAFRSIPVSIRLFICLRDYASRESLRVISTARLNVSPRLHLPPIDVVVFNDPQGDLILWLASRLDAFSAYPYQTRLPGGAPGGTTG